MISQYRYPGKPPKLKLSGVDVYKYVSRSEVLFVHLEMLKFGMRHEIGDEEFAILCLRFADYSVEEVAKLFKQSPRRIEQKLQRIKQLCNKMKKTEIKISPNGKKVSVVQ